MDIASLSMGLSQSQTLTDVGTAMLSKSLDMAKMNGNTVAELLDSAAMERSVYPDIGGSIDYKV